MIVKVQKPITGPTDRWLVYDRARSIVRQIVEEDVPEHVKTAMAHSYKRFFHARIDELARPKKIIFSNPAPPQPW